MISFSSIEFNCNNVMGNVGSTMKDLCSVFISANFRVCVALLDDKNNL